MKNTIIKSITRRVFLPDLALYQSHNRLHENFIIR